MITACHILVLMVLRSHGEAVSCLDLVVFKLALLLRKGLYVEQGYPVIPKMLVTGPC